MLTKSQMDRKFAELALKAGAPLTPARAAAEAEMDQTDEDVARRQRERVQHEAEPYREVSEVDPAELGKRYNQAFEVEFPDGYPPLRPVDAERFRRGPVSAGHVADSPAYGPPGQAVPVPAATLTAGMITRPALTGGQSRPCAPDAC